MKEVQRVGRRPRVVRLRARAGSLGVPAGRRRQPIRANPRRAVV